jgi:hypothetical protein
LYPPEEEKSPFAVWTRKTRMWVRLELEAEEIEELLEEAEKIDSVSEWWNIVIEYTEAL